MLKRVTCQAFRIDGRLLASGVITMNLDELTRNCFQSGFSAPKVGVSGSVELMIPNRSVVASSMS